MADTFVDAEELDSTPEERAASWDEHRAFFDMLSDHVNDWQGIPVPLDDERSLVLARDHPLRDVYAEMGFIDDIEVEVLDAPGMPEEIAGEDTGWEHTCTSSDVREDERIVNHWYSRKRNADVYVVQTGDRYYAALVHRSPDRAMDRLTLWLRTIGASDAWDMDAEAKARETLRAMLSERQWRHYDLTGSFFETSPRSNLTYVFRRLRPTLALTPRWSHPGIDQMRCLAVLCLHPIGYYSRSWAGCMVPSDDVIAHLAWMRGDEAGFWKQANQHDAASPEAGL